MDNIPRTPDEYRRWWADNTETPYGYCWCGCGQQTTIPHKTSHLVGRIKDEPIRYVRGHSQRQDGPSTAQEHQELWERESPGTPYGLCRCGCGLRSPIARKTSSSEGALKGCPRRFIQGHQARLSPVEYIEEDHGHRTPCWIWQRYLNASGYGQLFFHGRVQPAHRIYYEREYGAVPQGLELDHRCEVKSCVNPTHLEATTHLENTRRGSHTKLTLEKARKIKRIRREQNLTYPQLAIMFGVSRSLIGEIMRGRVWRDA